MKFSYSAALIFALMVSFIMAAPVTESSASPALPVASISIIDITVTATPTPSQPAVIPVADAMSGANATASISIIGQNVTAQSSGADRTFVGAVTIALPAAIISALLLV